MQSKNPKENFAQNIQNEKIIIYCKTCGEPSEKELFEKTLGRWYHTHVFCKCERGIEFKYRFDALMKNSLLGKRYKNVSFENSKTGINADFDNALNRCKKYCENYKKVLENGQGIYIYGSIGVGKTHLTACIANKFMNHLIPVLFTNLSEIAKAMKLTFNRNFQKTEQNLMEKFSNIKVLFFDDLGIEIFTKNQEDNWLSGILFDIVNLRYNLKLSTIFSSNYSLNDLINQRKISERTVDRIVEMTDENVIKIIGESFRTRKI